jgi:hypothetical protein
MTKLGIGKLTSTILTSRRSQRHSLALTRGAEKSLKRANGYFEATEGGFWEIRSTKIEKNSVFLGQEALFPEVSLPKWRALKPQAKKEGGKSWKCRVIRFSAGKAKRKAKLN